MFQHILHFSLAVIFSLSFLGIITAPTTALAACEVTVAWQKPDGGVVSNVSQLGEIKPGTKVGGLVTVTQCTAGHKLTITLHEEPTGRLLAGRNIGCGNLSTANQNVDVDFVVPSNAQDGYKYTLSAVVSDVCGGIPESAQADTQPVTVSGVASLPPPPIIPPPSITPPPPVGGQPPPPTTISADGCDKLIKQFQDFTGSAPSVLAEQCTSPGGAIKRAVNIALGVAAGLAVLFLVIGAIRYMSAAGNATTIQAAVKTMQWAVIGLVLILLAYAIVAMVTNLLTG